MDPRNPSGKGESLSFLASVASTQLTNFNNVMNQQPILAQQLPLNTPSAYAVASQSFVTPTTQAFLPTQSPSSNGNFITSSVPHYNIASPYSTTNSLSISSTSYSNMAVATATIAQQPVSTVFPASILHHPLNAANVIQLQDQNSSTAPLLQQAIPGAIISNQITESVSEPQVTLKIPITNVELNGVGTSGMVIANSVLPCLKVPQVGNRTEQCNGMFHTIREALSVADSGDNTNNQANNVASPADFRNQQQSFVVSRSIPIIM